MTTLTEEMIDAGVSENGGFNYKQLRTLGVPMPLKSGWKQRLIGTSITKNAYGHFLKLKNAHVSATGKRYSAKAGKYREVERIERELVIEYLEGMGLLLAAQGIAELAHHPKS